MLSRSRFSHILIVLAICALDAQPAEFFFSLNSQHNTICVYKQKSTGELELIHEDSALQHGLFDIALKPVKGVYDVKNSLLYVLARSTATVPPHLNEGDLHFYNFKVRPDGSLGPAGDGISGVSKNFRHPALHPKNNRLYLFDSDDSVAVYAWKPQVGLSGHSIHRSRGWPNEDMFVNSAHFSPDGRLLIVTLLGAFGTTQLSEIFVYKVHKSGAPQKSKNWNRVLKSISFASDRYGEYSHFLKFCFDAKGRYLFGLTLGGRVFALKQEAGRSSYQKTSELKLRLAWPTETTPAFWPTDMVMLTGKPYLYISSGNEIALIQNKAGQLKYICSYRFPCAENLLIDSRGKFLYAYSAHGYEGQSAKIHQLRIHADGTLSQIAPAIPAKGMMFQ